MFETLCSCVPYPDTEVPCDHVNVFPAFVQQNKVQIRKTLEKQQKLKFNFEAPPPAKNKQSTLNPQR